jgi:hypothetical protein
MCILLSIVISKRSEEPSTLACEFTDFVGRSRLRRSKAEGNPRGSEVKWHKERLHQ